MLDPANYYTIAGYSYDAMLRFTRVEIEHLPISSGYFKKCKIFNENIVGFFILELSKLHMYRFWYDGLKRKYFDVIYRNIDITLLNIQNGVNEVFHQNINEEVNIIEIEELEQKIFTFWFYLFKLSRNGYGK